jgi:hypothetical protein
VLLTNADVDHVAGLLTLRESQPLSLYGTGRVLGVLADIWENGQAMALTGDAANMDPVCSKSPLNEKIRTIAEAEATADDAEMVYRSFQHP